MTTAEIPPASDDPRFPARLVVVVGTYDGVLAGWDTRPRNVDDDAAAAADAADDVDVRLLRRKSAGARLKLSFATAAHSGSVRCLAVAPAPPPPRGGGDDGDGGGGGGENRQKRKKKRGRDAPDGDARLAENGARPAPDPGALLSGGFDDALLTYDLRRRAQSGELKAPADLGSPLCCSFAPPGTTSTTDVPAATPTHALVGTTSGKIVLYRKRDWSVQHVLSGHDGPVSCLAVHPTGRAALSGGQRDGRLCLWDLTKGRLAFVHKLPPSSTSSSRSSSRSSSNRDAIHHVTWSDDGSRYALCHGTKITARCASTGEDLLDVSLPARANQATFVGGPEGMFLAAACDDGGLPVLEVGKLSDLLDNGESGEGDDSTRRAIMAIEPVIDRPSAGEDRFKCIRAAAGGSGFLVVTANSGGVVSLMDLEGAAQMMLVGEGEDNDGDDDDDDDDDDDEKFGKKGKKTRKKEGGGSDSDDSDDSDSDDESSEGDVEAAVEILDSVRLGSGARITDLAVWSYGGTKEDDLYSEGEGDGEGGGKDVNNEENKEETGGKTEEGPSKTSRFNKGRASMTPNPIEMDAETVEKARLLVGQAKARDRKQKEKEKKKKGEEGGDDMKVEKKKTKRKKKSTKQ